LGVVVVVVVVVIIDANNDGLARVEKRDVDVRGVEFQNQVYRTGGIVRRTAAAVAVDAAAIIVAVLVSFFSIAPRSLK